MTFWWFIDKNSGNLHKKSSKLHDSKLFGKHSRTIDIIDKPIPGNALRAIIYSMTPWGTYNPILGKKDTSCILFKGKWTKHIKLNRLTGKFRLRPFLDDDEDDGDPVADEFKIITKLLKVVLIKPVGRKLQELSSLFHPSQAWLGVYTSICLSLVLISNKSHNFIHSENILELVKQEFAAGGARISS